jgi:hypothetical protein
MDIKKVVGMLALHCNGMTYGNAYLITFKVGPLRTHKISPSLLPLLQAQTKSFFWNLGIFFVTRLINLIIPLFLYNAGNL